MSSGELTKYEYLTGEYLGYKPCVIELVKIDYSALGKVFNKGLDKDDQKEGLFKRLKIIESNIKGKSEKQSKAIKNEKQPTQLKELNLNEISRSLWIKFSIENFNSLIKDIVDNLHNEDYKTTLDGDKQCLKNAENIFLEISIKKFNENEARELYKDLIEPDHNTLMNAKCRGKNKRSNILSVLSNIE